MFPELKGGPSQLCVPRNYEDTKGRGRSRSKNRVEKGKGRHKKKKKKKKMPGQKRVPQVKRKKPKDPTTETLTVFCGAMEGLRKGGFIGGEGPGGATERGMTGRLGKNRRKGINHKKNRDQFWWAEG